ncbi:MAG: DinB family protein [Ignavibacteria bacterium]|nr:DinB family protein [Ignavibacteria bacterium]
MAKQQIELMLYMLEDIRKVTLKGVSGLSKEQLFAEPVPGESCIGSYIMHLAEAELGWLKTLSGEDQPEDLKKRIYYGAWFDVPAKDYLPPKEPIEPEEYINAITEVRERLLTYIRNMDDSDLETIQVNRWVIDGVEKKHECSKKWIIYHLIEHEAHTRGQMFMLIRMAGFKKKVENN